jgi:hypothetical protein
MTMAFDRSGFGQIALAPQEISGSSAVKGDGVDRGAVSSASGMPALPHSLRVDIQTGAASGTPDSFSLACKLQHSNTDSDGAYVDVTSLQPSFPPTATITAEDCLTSIYIDAQGLKRFCRLVVTPTFTGGDAPAILTSATFAWSDCKELVAVLS